MSSILRGLGSLIALLAALIGVPLLLGSIGRLGALGSVNWAKVFVTPDDGSLLLGLITLIAWLAWAVVALTIVLEAVSFVSRGAITVALPGTNWLRPVVASLILSVGALVVAAPHAPPLAEDGETSAPGSQAPGSPESASTIPETEGDQGQRHVVVAGDDLWSLAEHYFGKGTSWRLIAKANPWLDPTARLDAGSILVIPQDPDAASPPQTPALTPVSVDLVSPPPVSAETKPAGQETGLSVSEGAGTGTGSEPADTTARVEPGDTLWSIAEQHLGDPWRWREIYQLNSGLIGDPDQIDVGWVLQLPPKSPVPPAEPSPTASKPDGDTVATDAAEEQPEVSNVPPNSTEGGQPAPSVAPTPEGHPSSPADGRNAPTGAPSVAEDNGSETAEAAAADSLAAELTTFGGVLAFGVLTFLSQQRGRQLLTRSLGRQVPPVSVAARRLGQALTRRATPPGEDEPSPTSVLVGWDADRGITVDLEQIGMLTVAGNAEHQAGALAAITSSLLTAPWSADVEQVLIGRHQCWVDQVNDPRIQTMDDPSAAIAEMSRLVSARQRARLSQQLSELRSNPDLSTAWRPIVFVFAQPLAAGQATQVRDLATTGSGISAVVADCGLGLDDTISYANQEARFGGRTFTAQLISSPARRGLIELFRTATSEETKPAPWWSDPDHLPPNVTPLRRTGGANEEPPMPVLSRDTAHPVLLMLGPVAIEGACGTPPSRAVKQCAEYCAWLLAHPGQTATAMAADLQVAEPTRRSNMSRLRNWLGESPAGEPYLPDAYSGRIELHPGVTSDWEQFCLLTAGGINRAQSTALRDALALVRGAPLADAAPWQWQWAENMRTDMISAIRDAGVVLSEHALTLGDIDLSRWAIGQASLAAPEDELLLACLAKTEYRAGNHDEVRKLALRITRNARHTGIDLQERTVEALQQVMEGRSRTRHA